VAPLTSRQARLGHLHTLAQSWGWEPDPTFHSFANPGDYWWLPQTSWRLRCTPQACSIYRLKAHGRPTETKTYPLSALGDIRRRFAQIHASRTAPEAPWG
jgi:hypothetical protein